MARSNPAKPGRADPQRKGGEAGTASVPGNAANPSPDRPGAPQAEREPDDVTLAPESGEKPEVMPSPGPAAR